MIFKLRSGLHSVPRRGREIIPAAVLIWEFVVSAFFLGGSARLRAAERGPNQALACPCAASEHPVGIAGGDLFEAVADLESLVPPKAVKVERPTRSYRVLILGDSLALCGFGKTLDSKLRTLAQVESVSTYMACGSVPTTWLNTGPLATARTACGFWSIEGSKGNSINEIRDTFGMEKGRRPGVHTVPKLEQLGEAFQPDILIMQNGTNLLSLFSDGQTILAERHGSQIRSYMRPFVHQLARRVHSLKKVYWVTPPVTGRASKAAQDFLFAQMNAYSSPLIEFIDSRAIVPFPYKNPMADKEHFIGKDMEVWADRVFKVVQKDIVNDAYSKVASGIGTAPDGGPTSPAPDNEPVTNRASLSLRARLVAKSQPLPLEKILPYQESMVGFLYRVEQVLSGSYAEKELLVMHPAHIAQKPLPLEKYAIGTVYSMDLIEFEGSPWEAIKRTEETGRIELLPFILKEDEARFPSAGR